MVRKMTTKLAVATVVAVLPMIVVAQGVTTSEGVEGPSGDNVFSQSVRGADGLLYNCQPNIVSRNGVPTRLCRVANGGALGGNGGFTNIGGIGGAAAAAPGLLTLLVTSALSSGNSTSGTQ